MEPLTPPLFKMEIPELAVLTLSIIGIQAWTEVLATTTSSSISQGQTLQLKLKINSQAVSL